MTLPLTIVAGVGIVALLLVLWQSTQPNQVAKGSRLLAAALLLVSINLLVLESGANEQTRLWSSIALATASGVLTILGVRIIHRTRQSA